MVSLLSVGAWGHNCFSGGQSSEPTNGNHPVTRRASESQPSWSRRTDGIFWIQRFLDRWYGSDRKAIFPGKRVILTIPFEDTTAAAPRHTVGILTESLNYVGAEVVATVFAPGVHRRGEVSQRRDLMAAARKVGNSAAKG